eukprot:CAMPEP_0197519088 /NCGR_PEP_ID=MMETSP1318-20131121/4346_1 /TAXON_ID=552666 /ORGANISM="Partenskyella glossopodia, Strain RCC365" /LENGTH=408 /DNA_ID=CAMNT_0043069873 /DNA_START=186 /DNA_END=1412 /DNA_ORIENTATION=+
MEGDGAVEEGKGPEMTKAQIAAQKARAKSAPSFVMLVGIPGSGKSTFRNELLKLNNVSHMDKKWQVISQDELRSRRRCEDQVGRLVKDSKNRVILDRCNPDSEDRKYWLRLAWKPNDAVAVYFATESEECIKRIRSRRNHETLNNTASTSKLEMIIRGFRKRLVIPHRAEGFRRVYTIENTTQAADLLVSWGCESAAVHWMRQLASDKETKDSEKETKDSEKETKDSEKDTKDSSEIDHSNKIISKGFGKSPRSRRVGTSRVDNRNTSSPKASGGSRQVSVSPPKKLSPFYMFVRERLAENPIPDRKNGSRDDRRKFTKRLMGRLSKKWNAFEPAERKKYEELSAAEIKRYEELSEKSGHTNGTSGKSSGRSGKHVHHGNNKREGRRKSSRGRDRPESSIGLYTGDSD